MSFHDVRFPTSISFGSTGGPERRTEIVTLSNGFEERNAAWAHSRRRYDAGLGVRTLDELHDVVGFFEARMGRLFGFRWKDWADYKSGPPGQTVTAADQEIGTGDGATTVFLLGKSYTSGTASYLRPISKPVAGTVQIAVDGSAQVDGTDFTIDTSTGEVTFTAAPANTSVITAGFEFDVPVRFDADRIETNVTTFAAGEIPEIPVIEVRV